ncbi:WD repeat-containing protein 27 isoform X2 [Electrophorus electricus]|uniref:WD repeat-containing protein 27 isoform X2 n=1 Tax=Electrophorus electricus TaxID=8005 RepID=UPI0015CF96C3|nr:WD repeat-containing protein 27 isoform X2 [Electrophorus electricus]
MARICGTGMKCIVEKFSLDSEQPMTHLQLACCSSHYAFPRQGKNLEVYRTTSTERPLHLTGHHSSVSALVFGEKRTPLLLCSASEDYVIVWDVECCYRQVREGIIATGVVVGTMLGKAVHLSLCTLNKRVAVCSGSRVIVVNAKRQEVLAVLNGHLGPVTASGFCPWEPSQLISVSEDRTFKIWDVNTEEILYQSSVLSGCPLLSLYFMDKHRQFVTGSADGQVWCYTLPEDHKCHMVMKLDLQKLEQRHQKSVKSSNQQQTKPAGLLCDGQRGEGETAKPVLSIWAQSPQLDPSSMQQRNSEIWIGSLDGLYLLDLATSELLVSLHFREIPGLSILMVGSWATSQGHNNKMWCLVTSLFEAKVALLDVTVAGLNSLCFLTEKAFSWEESLSVFPSSSPVPTSPLNAELKKREPKSLKKTGVRNHALVFHTMVKSSGYAMCPHRTIFTPKTNIKQKSNTSKESKNNGAILQEYPSHSTAPSAPHTQVAISTMPTTIHCLQYSGDAKQFMCGLADGSVFMYKASITGSPAVYTGHNKPVTSVCWSHSRQWFLSVSDDHTLAVWPTEVTEPAMTMGKEGHLKAIRWAQFYYLDKFILLACGSSLRLYLYHLDQTKDDIKRYKQKSMFKLSSTFSTYLGTDISAVSAVNDFYSYIILAAGADHSIQVFDMNHGCVAAKITEAHCRAVHHLCQNKGSMFSTKDQDSYNLFLSSAVTDGIKLWDLRTTRCVRRYESHLNRRHCCTVAVSPCGRYVATGSEDNCAYVYDIRSSSFLHKLQRQSDTVLNVAFNPATPELLTGTMDGKLTLFRL